MKALVLHEPNGPLSLQEVTVREPDDDEVLLRVRACGLGLTLVWNRGQRQAFAGESAKLPRIIGHEVAGDVVRAGAGVAHFRPGDRAAVYFYLVCGDCRWCNDGRDDLCDHFAGYVGKDIDGGLAEYLVVPARNLCAIPPRLSYVDAAVATDAIATPFHVLTKRARVAPAETVLVVGGGGGVGVHMVQMARALGARPIAVDVTDEKLALAADAGADATIDARSDALDEATRELTAGRGADVVVELVGTAQTLDRSFSSLAKGGRLVFVGTYDPTAQLTISPRALTAGELVLTGSRYCTRRDLADTMTMVALGRVRPIVTRTCSLDEADAVLQAIERREIAGRAAVVMD